MDSNSLMKNHLMSMKCEIVSRGISGYTHTYTQAHLIYKFFNSSKVIYIYIYTKFSYLLTIMKMLNCQ